MWPRWESTKAKVRLLRLIFTKDGISVCRSRDSPYNRVKTKQRSPKLESVGAAFILWFPFFSDGAYDSIACDLAVVLQQHFPIFKKNAKQENL